MSLGCENRQERHHLQALGLRGADQAALAWAPTKPLREGQRKEQALKLETMAKLVRREPALSGTQADCELLRMRDGVRCLANRQIRRNAM